MTLENKKPSVFIGLGSNLNDPVSQVETALLELNQINGTQLVAQSSLYRSDPVGPQDQPDFINAVAELVTDLAPEALLDELQAIEQQHNRKRIQHWGPRTLDLDILLFGSEIIHSDRLTIPHPYAVERSFVLWPLAEIQPDLVFPNGQRLNDLLVSTPLGTLERM